MEEPEVSEPTYNRSAMLTQGEALLLRHRVAVNILIHTFLFALALLLAYVVRFDIAAGSRGETQKWFFRSYLPMLPLFVVVKLFLFGRFKLFRGGWQYASIRDVTNIWMASFLFLLFMWCTVLVFRWGPNWAGRKFPYIGDYFASYSMGVMLLDFLASVFLVCTARLGFRLYREEYRPVAQEGITRVLIVGAGNAAETIIREIFRMRVERYRVVGMVDDDPGKKGIFIHGLPVLGTTGQIRQICEDKEVEEIIIAMPAATQKELRRVIELCSGTKLKFLSLPGVGDLIDGRVMVSQIRPVDINDLLSREQVELDTEALGHFLRNRRVLITGAGGSIGAEMCRQVSRFGPAELILIEQAENPLFEIENELRGLHPDIPVVPIICDIYDRTRVMQVWERHHPEVVIHAAAHKHVPLMERNPCEAIKNNIIGTQNAADASYQFGVAEFVLISTDKAVNPSSVMGASKRVAEMYTEALNAQGDCRTQFKAVRFGNVLDSSGSVVPTFRRQIAAGGPITVTHRDMTRYFMTISEASQLVLQAAATGSGGQIYLLDMGEPVRIVDLARQMITLSGFRPGEDIDVVFTGIRPGEKLFEELRTKGEDLEPTVHPKILIWKHKPVEYKEISQAIEELKALKNSPDREGIVSLLQGIIPEYEPMSPPETTAGPPTKQDEREFAAESSKKPQIPEPSPD